jgi:hypothetical protein
MKQEMAVLYLIEVLAWLAPGEPVEVSSGPEEEELSLLGS